MSCGSLPPVPGLIPISALRKSPSCNNNDLRECTPCAVQKEVMGEQRPRRTGSQPPVDLIDTARRSRGSTDIPQAPSGKARAERHRKSDRRRERKGGRKRSTSKCEKSVNPRVNPIFVWIRQEDTHIVDVKCEDYDKRNRIVLTKTAQGWRAIPRTETLVPNLKAAAAMSTANSDEESFKQQEQHHRKVRKSNRVKRKSTAVQVDEDDDITLSEDSKGPTWNVPVNIESHLPSHTIKVQRKHLPCPEQIDDTENVNTSADHNYIAHVSTMECSASKVCDVSPLDNLLAVAELEFNQQIQTEAWRDAVDLQEIMEDTRKSDDANLQQNQSSDNFESEYEKEEDCDYNEEEENNLAMDDLLNRLEQSLQSPDTLSEFEEEKHTEVPDVVASESKEELVCSTVADEKPTDLSTKKTECLTITLPDEDLMPTDLSVPKKKSRSPSPNIISPRPSSRCSETIQSPQPSGLPAVPHSPDVQTGTKTAYLESLLSSTSHKLPLNSEVTITKQSEPLDFGKSRKSASPTVTCSEEINTCSSSTGTSKDGEPEIKKGKFHDITLRNILDAATLQNRQENGKTSCITKSESRLLELLTSETSEPDALTQLKQLHADSCLNLPDPMLVPKDRLSQILLSPGKEIPKLLNERPELRLPEALAFPHLLQDPDILVITISQLETIIKKQTSINLPNDKQVKSKKPVEIQKSEKEKSRREYVKPAPIVKEVTTPRVPELCSDPNLTNMMWLPYLHQLELAAMAFGNGADFLKMISSFPPYSNQPPEMSQMFPLNRFAHPTSFPMPPLPNSNNPFEFPIWHENAQSNFPRSNQYDRLCNNNKYREYVDKTKNPQKFINQKPQFSSSVYQPPHAIPPHTFMNVPAPYQSVNSRVNLHVPQYNTILTQKNPMYNNKSEKSPSEMKSSNLSHRESAKNLNNQKYNQKSCNQKLKGESNNKKVCDFVTQPMDLSGSTVNKFKNGGKHNFSDSVNVKSLKFDDIPEVGSTTASIEDIHMQESQKHLWHPLFGNQKSSSNPWNWTTVTATGE